MKSASVFKTLFLVITSLSVNAQKLPKVQTGSLRAPANIKIDGKATELDNKFQAFNPNNRLNYTIANDDENLYLFVQAGDGFCGEKALYGIKFTIKLPAEKESIAITFPKYTDVQNTQKIRNTINTIRSLNGEPADVVKRKRDSLQLFVNSLIGFTHKEIIVEGIKAIPDPVIAVYNTDGIKASAQFVSPMRYNYELAIPLKYLGAMINSGQKFDYNIKMTGVPEIAPNGMAAPKIEDVSFGGAAPPPTAGNDYFSSNQGFVVLPTDFSGTYTLAKK